MAQAPVYGFGPFQLDMQRRRLVRENEPVAIADRYLDILHRLVSEPGAVIAKDDLIAAAWKGLAVTDNSLAQAIFSLRRLLGSQPDGTRYIEVLPRRGYRFAAAVTSTAPRHSDDALADLLMPFRMFVEGRAAVETLGRQAVHDAVAAFAAVVERQPDYAPAHLGLANACALLFDATRLQSVPDITALTRAGRHARDACRLDPDSGEAWATLAFVLSRSGASPDAVAAGRRATALEPDNWRHHLRLAYAAWGEERLRAARRAIGHLPGLGLASWLVATVLVARQAFGEALRELERGTTAQAQHNTDAPFSAVGLYLLTGLVHLAQGDRAAARQAFERELSFERAGHLYGSQACASAWYGLGGLDHAEGRIADASAAFERALERAPAHQMALAALAALSRGRRRESLCARLVQRVALLELGGAGVDAAAARAVGDVLAGRHGAAVERVADALDRQTPGSSTGWGLPVDPMLGVWHRQADWAPVLAALRARAA